MIILEKVVVDLIHHPKYIENTVNEETALEMSVSLPSTFLKY